VGLLGWISVSLFLAAAKPAPVPALVLPDCVRAARAPTGDFAVRVRRGVNVSYAAPITFSGWRTQAACRQLSAAARMGWRRTPGDTQGGRFHTGLARLRLAATFTYAFTYDHRHTLQRVQPGIEVFGSLTALPQTRCFLALGLVDWGLRLESTLDLAALEAQPAWLAAVDYRF
jgi:hypothetical protein